MNTPIPVVTIHSYNIKPQKIDYTDNIDIDAFVYYKDNFMNKMKLSTIPNFNKLF